MFCFKAPGRSIQQDFISEEWGEFIRYLEVADDQFANRQVEVFDNGNVLHYDRMHWCDDFGMLLGLRFSRKAKWVAHFPGAEIISPTEFEKTWRLAQRSQLWEDQQCRSRATQWGALPFWLRPFE